MTEPEVTTTGLQWDTPADGATTEIPWAIAAGTADTITANYSPVNTGLTDGLILGVRALLANLTATPTFNPDSIGSHTITKNGGDPLIPGDIAGPLHELFLRYNLANTRWELLNPANDTSRWAVAAGSADALTATFLPTITALPDGLLLYVRASAANVTSAPTFAPNGLTTYSITRHGGAVLVPGDIPGALAELILRFNLANTRWELLNPAGSSAELFKILAADDTAGQNVNTAQPWFPTAGAVSVAANTTYTFEGQLWTTRSAGASSHTTGVSFGGTATLTDIFYFAQCKTGDANDLQTISGFEGNSASTLVVKAASTSTTENVLIRVRGEVRINAAGTFIPQFIYSAAPGGAPTVKNGTFFMMSPKGSGSVTTQGTWA